MATLAHRIHSRYFRHWPHPYETFEAEVEKHMTHDTVLLDAGCGRSAPVLVKYWSRVRHVIGIDVVPPLEGLTIEYHQRELTDTGLKAESVDLIMARSVVEHLDDPEATYTEFCRILKPGGRFVFLTANLWDYASLIAASIPNRLHPWIVRNTEGRDEIDTFPTRFRSNTKSAVYKFAARSGLDVESFRYVGQHPRYLQFNGPLYWLGSMYELGLKRFGLDFLRGWIMSTLKKPPSRGQ